MQAIQASGGLFGFVGHLSKGKRLGFDDALDVWGVHGMGGFMGTVLLPGR